MKIGIIVAMTSELDCVLTLLQKAHKEMHNHAEFYIGSDGQHEIILTAKAALAKSMPLCGLKRSS